MAGGASRLRRAANRIGFPCASFSRVPGVHRHSHRSRTVNISSSGNAPGKPANMEDPRGIITGDADAIGKPLQQQSLCAICLEALASGGGPGGGDGGGPDGGQAIFTAQCMHSFHFVCISSNVRYGSVTCPICRAQWTQLPRDLAPLPCQQQAASDPILRILDDSIATFRVNRRISLRSARYDDDDPVEPQHAPAHPRLRLALVPVPLPMLPPAMAPPLQGVSPRRHPVLLHQYPPFSGPSSLVPSPQHGAAFSPPVRSGVCLWARLSHQKPTDIVLVASPNGPHLRLLKQSMALVVFSLRAVDRLAIVTYSSVATRALPLRRMTSHGKRTALQVIDRVFYLGEADPIEGLKKGAKILEDRTHQNPLACILHLSDSPTRAYVGRELQVPFPIHRFHIGFGFGASNGFVMHEFEEFLSRLLGGVIRETQLRVGEEGRLVRLGEMRGGEERRIPLDLLAADCGYLCVGFSYIEGGVEECLRTGEVVVGMADKGERSDGAADALSIGARSSNVERWDYLDPFMARRWAKHLHGYRA
ncbi:hypothetical protein Taro_021282 [Colocasia esculenta]|uniref:RING-type domain-containing protein n=1 Tax=Colocasia esculenta TaxID=4460 RepID=A0A843V7Q8_COLES|nr:hypothetical protein [Colocasia esculenta]